MAANCLLLFLDRKAQIVRLSLSPLSRSLPPNPSLHPSRLQRPDSAFLGWVANTQFLHSTHKVYSWCDMDSDNPNENYQIVVAEEAVQPYKRRKKKSIVWEHFTIEYVGDGCRRAFCKECKQSFAYSTGSKVAGTSHLKRHIPNGQCAAILRSELKDPSTPFTPKSNTRTPRRRYKTSVSPNVTSGVDQCRHTLAKMMIMHDYDLHMVEHNGFITFLQNLQPRYETINFSTLQGDCIATYLREKNSIMSLIEGIPGRISLAIDMWSSPQSTGFIFITGYYIDSDWKSHRRLLNVVMEPFPESETAFSHAVAVCLSDWGLENKLFSLTISQSLSDAAVEHLRAQMSIKKDHILDGQLLIQSCLARTLSSMVVDIIHAGQEAIKKVRDNVKYVKLSASHEEKFLELKQQLQIPSERTLTLDDQAKWNTTYDMLVAAFELKEVFSCLDTFDPDYKEALNMDQWKQVETLCTFMKLFYDTANVLTTESVPTANSYFHEICKIQMELARAGISDDPFVTGFFPQIQEKFDRLWRDSCLILATAVVIDPRFKMKLVEFSFTKIYGEHAGTYIKIVDDGIHALFQDYEALPLPLTPAYTEAGNIDPNHNADPAVNNGLADFDVFIMKTNSQQSRSELDMYLEESLLPRLQDFDVSNWWYLNKTKYPTLSKLARDILSLPVSTVTGDSVFDTEPKEMDPYRSSLRPETVEAIICTKDWLLQGAVAPPTWSDQSNATVKMETVA
uniref:BED-type domain-containing protein n=1 Tax=Kalanchoe fedtschenkoi TaxID=63787 RepID=A0A7N0TZ45_KALFE